MTSENDRQNAEAAVKMTAPMDLSSKEQEIVQSASFDSKGDQQQGLCKMSSVDSAKAQDPRTASALEAALPNGGNCHAVDNKGQPTKKPTAVGYSKPPRNPTPPRDMRYQNAASRQFAPQQKPQQGVQAQPQPQPQKRLDELSQPQQAQLQQTGQAHAQQPEPQPQVASQPPQGQQQHSGQSQIQQMQQEPPDALHQMQQAQRADAQPNQPQQAEQIQQLVRVIHQENPQPNQIAPQQLQYPPLMQSMQNQSQPQSQIGQNLPQPASQQQNQHQQQHVVYPGSQNHIVNEDLQQHQYLLNQVQLHQDTQQQYSQQPQNQDTQQQYSQQLQHQGPQQQYSQQQQQQQQQQHLLNQVTPRQDLQQQYAQPEQQQQCPQQHLVNQASQQQYFVNQVPELQGSQQQQSSQQQVNHQQNQPAPAQYTSDLNQSYQAPTGQQQEPTYAAHPQQQGYPVQVQQQPPPQQQQGYTSQGSSLPQYPQQQQPPQYPVVQQQQHSQPINQPLEHHQTVLSLPQLGLATDQQQLRKQFDDQAKLQLQQAQHSFQPAAQTPQIVGMVGTTPIVKIQGTAGHVVKKKKGRFTLLEEAPAATGITAAMALPPVVANSEAVGQALPAVVVAEVTSSNGSVMSQITSSTHAPQTIDGTGVPVVKKKGRFMVTNVTNPGLITGQLVHTNPPPSAEVARPLETPSLPPLAVSPFHQKSSSGDQSIQGNQPVSRIGSSPPQDQQQLLQQGQNGNGDAIIQPQQQQVLHPNNSIPAQVLPAQACPQHVAYPQQVLQTTAHPQYSVPQQMASDVLPNNGVTQCTVQVTFDTISPQPLQIGQSGGVAPMGAQHLVYTPTVNGVGSEGQHGQQMQQQQQTPQMQQPPQQQLQQQPLPPQQLTTQHQQVQQQQQQQTQQHNPTMQHHPHTPPTTPPTDAVSAVGVTDTIAPDQPTSVHMNAPPLKQGLVLCEDTQPPTSVTGAATPKGAKQPQTAPAIQTQPQRSKPRNLVAPRSTSVYGSGSGNGLGKVFYFLDQMRSEVTDADRTIKSLQQDMKFMREKNKELEAKNRELERKLREEQALREAAQARLKVLQKKSRDEVIGDEEDTEGQKNQSKAVVNESREKGTSSVLPLNGNKGKPASDSSSAAAPKNLVSSNTRNSHDASPSSGGAKLAGQVELSDEIISKSLKGAPGAKLESSNAVPPKPSKQNDGNAMSMNSRQETNEKVDNKSENNASGQGQLKAPISPVRPPLQSVSLLAEKSQSQRHKAAQNTQENARGAAGNGSSNVALPATIPPPDYQAYNTAPPQKKSTGGSMVPSVIEFDPLKSNSMSEVNISLDGNGRITPLDTLSVEHTGFTSLDAGLGGNGCFAIYNQYSQPYDVAAAGLLGQAQMVVPVVGIAPGTGLMGYHQASSATMQVNQPAFSQPAGETRSGGMQSNLSLLQQPFLQMSDPRSLQSMAVADLNQQMLLIQTQHVQSLSMHDFSQPMLHSSVDPGQIAAHHSRGNSLHTFQNLTPLWNQSGQWGSTQGQNLQQQLSSQQQVPPSDPFDELVSRRPLSTMSADGK